MKFQLTPKMVKVGATAVASVLLIFSFQNCGKAGFDSSLEDGLAQASTDPALADQFGKTDAVKVAAAPFAYEVLPDQIAYNSCTGASLARDPSYFTFKIGAYKSGGARLRQSFMDYLNLNFKPIYPATTLTVMQLKNFLTYSPANDGAQPQFSIRTRGKPQQIRTTNTAANLGVDFVMMLGSLTNDRFMDPIVRKGTSTNTFFPFALEANQRNIEAQISYNTNEALGQGIRNDFRNYAQLAITFTDKNNPQSYLARHPTSTSDKTVDTTRAYGRGYNLSFTRDQATYTYYSTFWTTGALNPRCPGNICGANLKANNPDNMLRTIQEVDLENPSVSTGVTWTCDPSRRYVVMKKTDEAKCPPENYGTNLAELEVIRRTLRAEDWQVNTTLKCAVPLSAGASCYPNEMLNGVAVGVEYDQTKECFQGVADQTYENPALPPTNRCAQYISICTRN